MIHHGKLYSFVQDSRMEIAGTTFQCLIRYTLLFVLTRGRCLQVHITMTSEVSSCRRPPDAAQTVFMLTNVCVVLSMSTLCFMSMFATVSPGPL